MAAWSLGMIVVPVSSRLRGPQVRHVLADSRASVLVTSTEYRRRMGFETDDFGGLFCLIDEVIATRNVSRPSVNLISGPSYPTNADDVSTLLYTSGSTGLPKGVVLSHRNLVEGAAVVSGYLGLKPSDCIAGVLPLSFDYGLNQLISSILVGCGYAAIDYFLPRDLVNAVTSLGVSVLGLVPHLWSQMIEASLNAGISYPEVRVVTSSGGHVHEKVSAQMADLFPNAEIFLMYGLTEAFRSTFLDPRKVTLKPRSVGRAVPGVEISVMDQNGGECPPGEVGEIVHRGALISLGYWNSPKETDDRFRRRPDVPPEVSRCPLEVWSGDLGYKDKEGDLFVLGRKDGLVKHKGFRLNVGEVEELVASCPSVLECVVVPRESQDLQTELVCFLRVSDGFGRDELVKLLRGSAPDYMIPDHFVVREFFPETSSGKVDRVALGTSSFG